MTHPNDAHALNERDMTHENIARRIADQSLLLKEKTRRCVCHTQEYELSQAVFGEAHIARFSWRQPLMLLALVQCSERSIVASQNRLRLLSLVVTGIDDHS